MQQQDPTFMFIVNQSRGEQQRKFIVPISFLMEEWADIEDMLKSGGEFAFDDKSNHRVLWSIGHRLGIVGEDDSEADTPSEDADLTRFECFTNSARSNIRGFLVGTVNN